MPQHASNGLFVGRDERSSKTSIALPWWTKGTLFDFVKRPSTFLTSFSWLSTLNSWIKRFISVFIERMVVPSLDNPYLVWAHFKICFVFFFHFLFIIDLFFYWFWLWKQSMLYNIHGGNWFLWDDLKILFFWLKLSFWIFALDFLLSPDFFFLIKNCFDFDIPASSLLLMGQICYRFMTKSIHHISSYPFCNEWNRIIV